MFRFGNGFSSRSGIAVTLTMCKSQPPKRWVWNRWRLLRDGGALRDMVPNHLSMVSLTQWNADLPFTRCVRDEQAKVLHAIMPPTPEEV